MIPLTNHDFQWGRSEVVIIYPDLCLIKQVDLHEIDRLEKAALRAALFFWENFALTHSSAAKIFTCPSTMMATYSHTHISLDWFKGKSTGNHGFYMFLPSNWSGFPVNFPIIQFYEHSNKNRESSFNQTSCKVFKSTMMVPLTSRPNVVTGRPAL